MGAPWSGGSARTRRPGGPGSNLTDSSNFLNGKYVQSKSLATENRGSVGDARKARKCRFDGERKEKMTSFELRPKWKTSYSLLVLVIVRS